MNALSLKAKISVENNVRSLSTLHKRGSTSRVLNLLRTHETALKENESIGRPFFSFAALNTAFIIKHNLRDNERNVFHDGRTTATKLLMPLDQKALDLGGQYIFINQPGFVEGLASAVGEDLVNRTLDLRTLEALERAPSFDPFLLREWLARFDIHPDPLYFNLNITEVMRMESFVQSEILELVILANDGSGHTDSSRRMVKKMLSNKYDRDLEPLRITLRFSQTEFHEGLFAWKGFLYYKWVAKKIENAIPIALRDMGQLRPQHDWDAATRQLVAESLQRLGRLMVGAFNEVADNLSAYDKAFQALTQGRDPYPFRAFLLAGPSLFLRIGELVGSLQHLLQFWSYRSRNKNQAVISADEYIELLRDFEASFTSSSRVDF